MKLLKINSNGMFLEDLIVEEKPQNMSNLIETPCPSGFYHPKWDGENWVEGLTQEEIDELNNQPQEPTENEMIMLAIAGLDTQREIDKTETELAIAELAETLLGGV